MTVSVWDWSGDPEYEAVLLPLLGYRGVYLLVFDASQPLDGPATATSWSQGLVRSNMVEVTVRSGDMLTQDHGHAKHRQGDAHIATHDQNLDCPIQAMTYEILGHFVKRCLHFRHCGVNTE